MNSRISHGKQSVPYGLYRKKQTKLKEKLRLLAINLLGSNWKKEELS
jgi:hypothetical protein